jgi:hypothetical protein
LKLHLLKTTASEWTVIQQAVAFVEVAADQTLRRRAGIGLFAQDCEAETASVRKSTVQVFEIWATLRAGDSRELRLSRRRLGLGKAKVATGSDATRQRL